MQPIFPTFSEWLAARNEGLWLNDKNAISGLSKRIQFPKLKPAKALTPPKPIKFGHFGSWPKKTSFGKSGNQL